MFLALRTKRWTWQCPFQQKQESTENACRLHYAYPPSPALLSTWGCDKCHYSGMSVWRLWNSWLQKAQVDGQTLMSV